MASVVWKVEPRKAAGKGGARKARAAGLVPTVAYGKDMTSISLSVSVKSIEDVIRTTNWAQALISLEGMPELAGKTFMIAEMQRHHYLGTPMALDLRSIRLDQKIRVQVPLEFLNVVKIKGLGGVLEVLHRTIEVKCLPTAIPTKITVDVGDLGLGHTLHLSDVTMPENAEVDLSSDYPVCTVVVPRTVEEEKAAAQAAEAAAAEGEAAAEGAAPAEGAEAKKEGEKEAPAKKEEGKKEKGK